MAKACDLKCGDLVAIQGLPHIVDDLKVSNPSARGAATIYRFRFRNLVTKAKTDVSCKGDEPFTDISVERRPAQYLYAQQDMMTFMDLEDFSQFVLLRGAIEEQAEFLVENMENITALTVDGKVLTIELPASVELKVVECDPVLRGASATARTKPATLETGLVVQVPEYLTAGETIRVDTRTRKFLQRA
jgi:elongation factor P